jgi:hypothetical protein
MASDILLILRRDEHLREPISTRHVIHTATAVRRQRGPAELSAINTIHRLRAIQVIIRLREVYADVRLDAACARAIAVGDPGYRTVKGILAAGTEQTA